MKKIYLSLISTVFVFALCVLPVSALSRVSDGADMLMRDEESTLSSSISSIAQTYDFDVVIVTVNDLGGKSAMNYADDYFDYNGYGLGSNRDGILLLISASRDYWISTSGSGQSIITDDYGIEKLKAFIQPLLSDDNYYGACEKFVSMTEEFLSAYASGNPYGDGNEYKEPVDYIFWEIIALVVAILTGVIVVSSMKKKMAPPKCQSAASSYVKKDTFQLTESSDIFLYSTLAKTPRPKQTSSSGGGGHIGSSGSSHGGGGGRF